MKKYFLSSIVFTLSSIVFTNCGTTQPTQNKPDRQHDIYEFITPPDGMKTIPVAFTGESTTIRWKDGPDGPVSISLIDWCDWVVFRSVVTSTPNTGSYDWKVPADLKCGVFCLYIQNADPIAQQWNYSVPIAIMKKSPYPSGAIRY